MTRTRPTSPTATPSAKSGRISWINFSSERSAAEGQPRAAQGHLPGHRPRSDHQADLAQYGHPGHRLGLTGGGRLQGRRCGDSCKFDAAAAKAAFEAAGGYKGTLTMTYNADSPNKAWSEAVCNSIKNTLGIECTAVPTVDFATYNKKIDANELKGIFRGRLADGLPVDRELPGRRSTPRVRPRVQLGPVQQPGVRRS